MAQSVYEWLNESGKEKEQLPPKITKVKNDWSISGNIDGLVMQLYAWRMANSCIRGHKKMLPKAISKEEQIRRDALFPVLYGFLSLAFAELPNSPNWVNYMRKADDVIDMIKNYRTIYNIG